MSHVDAVDPKKMALCTFCRTNNMKYESDKSRLEQNMKLVDSGNPYATFMVGHYYFNGEKGLQQDKVEGLKWYHRAVEAGSATAAHIIGNCYDRGDGVEQDIDKALEYYQKSADLGYITSFALTGIILLKKGEMEEAMLNLRKAVMCGISKYDIFHFLRMGFKEGCITKEENAYTLRENQAACNEMKSEAREKYKKEEGFD